MTYPHTTECEITEDLWKHIIWSDGNEQWVIDDIHPLAKHKEGKDILVERVVGPKSRRKNWVVVNRLGQGDFMLYPPKIAGPFPDLEAAKAAYLLLLRT